MIAIDRSLAGERQRTVGPQYVIGNHTAEDAAEEAAEGRQRGDEARLQDRQAALLNEIDREPGQEEISQLIDAELAEIDAEHHTAAQQLLDLRPGRPGVVGL